MTRHPTDGNLDALDRHLEAEDAWDRERACEDCGHLKSHPLTSCHECAEAIARGEHSDRADW